MESDLVAYLRAHAGLTALVGQRIYPLRLPQRATLPAVVYQRIDALRFVAHTGPSDLARPRFQFSCWADTYGGAKAVGDQIIDALHGFKGDMNGRDVSASFIINDADDRDDDTDRYRVILDAYIWHEEVA